MALTWRWGLADPTYQNFGNANQWTVSAGLQALARESTQNSNDALVDDEGLLVYEIIRLSGADRQSFEDAIGYHTELLPHLEAMSSVADAAVTARQIKAGLEAMAASDDLILLKVSDYGCRGLTGPELPSDSTSDGWGNLIKLCRLDLFSGKDEASGGSFGLGKAVYWRFSRLQTVLFNSTLRDVDEFEGQTQNRVLGVSQGVPHKLDSVDHVGRGFFGALAPEPRSSGEYTTSKWSPEDLDAMQLAREDVRSGTTALMLGFYDPDDPERSETDADGLRAIATALREAVEENFWPLLVRGRLKVKFRVVDNGTVTFEEDSNPAERFTELCNALKRYDDNDDMDDVLDAPFMATVQDIAITIPERVDDKPHPQFDHVAKLVVVMSDENEDRLENRVCLFRQPGMVVETIDTQFDGTTYHAFLLAGGAVNPAAPSDDERRAEDFLRLAEPPAHDQWIPRSGRAQASQANLTTATYRSPWGPKLKGIEGAVRDALKKLFDTDPEPDERGPQSIFKHLTFLASDPGRGGVGPSNAPPTPAAELTQWDVKDGQWHVTFQIRAQKQEGGWLVRPDLKILGLDGKGVTAAWESLSVNGKFCDLTADHPVRLPPTTARRHVLTVSGVSTEKLPIPADQSVIDVIIGAHAVGSDHEPEEGAE